MDNLQILEPMPDQETVQHEEFQRLIDLSELDLDYGDLSDSFKDLVRLAAHVAGTEISLVNLLDAYTQWTVAGYGFPTGNIPRKESVCQYAITQPDPLEVKDLMQDERFMNLRSLKSNPDLKYYFGLPLRTKRGYNIGTLCVLDRNIKELSPEKIELLKIIAGEIVHRLVVHQVIHSMHQKLEEAGQLNRRVAHDIRGPVGGIVGLADLILKKGEKNKLPEVLTFMNLIYKSGQSILKLSDEILTANEEETAQETSGLGENELNLNTLRERLLELYQPQATDKGITFDVEIDTMQADRPFPKKRLMQITGNLISNAFKFTPPLGSVTVQLRLEDLENKSLLHIRVSDTGIGLTEEQVRGVMQGKSSSTTGTKGEQGYGLGLQLVKHLLDGLHGSMTVVSSPGEGTAFDIKIPIPRPL
ncbi:GAF domain-containing sensor histidine kinase [uncultured Pontibacter sp.]|uniref:GAF domain-containing sensor histidine kinase n=1 Tax=uncultured Pontibacter sp. TaxID=453356 RepID=UPI002627A444|nr:GAF domain-containing sensor histidine kinase [uncultured Pontibacter sp.]